MVVAPENVMAISGLWSGGEVLRAPACRAARDNIRIQQAKAPSEGSAGGRDSRVIVALSSGSGRDGS